MHNSNPRVAHIKPGGAVPKVRRHGRDIVVAFLWRGRKRGRDNVSGTLSPDEADVTKSKINASIDARRTASEPVAFPVEGVDGGSVSMLAVQVG